MALLPKMTCNLRHPMGLRHPVRILQSQLTFSKVSSLVIFHSQFSRELTLQNFHQAARHYPPHAPTTLPPPAQVPPKFMTSSCAPRLRGASGLRLAGSLVCSGLSGCGRRMAGRLRRCGPGSRVHEKNKILESQLYSDLF